MSTAQCFANLSLPIQDNLGVRGAKALHDCSLSKERPANTNSYTQTPNTPLFSKEFVNSFNPFYQTAFSSIENSYQKLPALSEIVESIYSSITSLPSVVSDLVSDSSLTQKYSIERLWDEKTPLIKELNKNFAHLKGISLGCSDSWKSTSKFYLDSFLPKDCKIILNPNQENEEVYNLESLVNNKDKKDDPLPILAAIHSSQPSSQSSSSPLSSKDLINSLIHNLKPSKNNEKIPFESTGGIFNVNFGSTSSIVDQVATPFFFGKNTPANLSTPITLKSDCSILQEPDNRLETCRHLLLSPTSKIATLYVQQKNDAITISSPDKSIAQNWEAALHQKGLSLDSMKASGDQFEITGYRTFSAQYLPKAPNTSGMFASTNLLSSLLIPLGIGIGFAGLHYAKATFDHPKKPLMRKIAGCVAGFVTAAFGITLSSIPFGSFKA